MSRHLLSWFIFFNLINSSIFFFISSPWWIKLIELPLLDSWAISHSHKLFATNWKFSIESCEKDGKNLDEMDLHKNIGQTINRFSSWKWVALTIQNPPQTEVTIHMPLRIICEFVCILIKLNRNRLRTNKTVNWLGHWIVICGEYCFQCSSKCFFFLFFHHIWFSCINEREKIEISYFKHKLSWFTRLLNVTGRLHR